MNCTHLIASLVLVLAGCVAAEPPAQRAEPRLPAPDANREYHVKFPPLTPGMTRYIALTLGDDIAQTCGLMRTHFEFDSAALMPADSIDLHGVAECLNRPENRDKGLDIVGRADTRGNAQYNLALGRRRAETVRQALVNAGIAENRLHVSTRGAEDAVGDNQTFSYGYDRRVDMVLLGVTHGPSR